MPGPAEENMVGDYTFAELSSMTKAALDAAQMNGFRRAAAEAVNPVGNDNVWATALESRTHEFVTPSGQKCKLREISPESLLESGILDRVTRLEGLAAELAEKAEGAPPTSKKKLPSREDLALLIDTVNLLVPLAVAEPAVYPDVKPDETAEPGRIYVSMIALDDRIAIMEESMKGLKALDAFRNA